MSLLDWAGPSHELILNPRLPSDIRDRFEKAWKDAIDNQLANQPALQSVKQPGLIGIATSGSSSDSFGRLILLSKSAILAGAQAVNERLGSSSKDVWLKALPDFHVGGLTIHARAYLSGARVIELIESDKDREGGLVKWDPQSFYLRLSSVNATLCSLVSTQLFDLVTEGFRAPSSLRAVFIGGGRLDRDLRERALQLEWPVLPTYGLTECSSQVATARSPQDPRLIPLSHVEVRSSQEGYIELRSPALLTGMIQFMDGKAEFVDPKVDGWFRTEDKGHLESEGTLTILGRTQDFFKIGGEGVIFSRLEERIEALRLSLKFDFDSALLAAADDRLGAKIVLITTAPAERAKTLVEAFNQAVLPFERIRSIHYISVLPRSAIGKLLRIEALTTVGLKPLSHT